MSVIFCACCGRPFKRPTNKGATPKYCSNDCRRQMAVRRTAWGDDWRAMDKRHDQARQPAAGPPAHGGMAGDD